jgi:hypothetical protein
LSDRTPAIKDLFLDHFYIIGFMPSSLNPSNSDDAAATDDNNNNNNNNDDDDNNNSMEQSFLRS